MYRYPTEKELKFIEEWSGHMLPEFLDYIETHWHWPRWGFKKHGKRIIRLELHTGGWSGNEEIIAALRKSWRGMFWFIFWRKSIRGGHYYFRIPL